MHRSHFRSRATGRLRLVIATVGRAVRPGGHPPTAAGIGTVNGEARWRTIAQVLTAWVTTLPVAAVLAAALAVLAPFWM